MSSIILHNTHVNPIRGGYPGTAPDCAVLYLPFFLQHSITKHICPGLPRMFGSTGPKCRQTENISRDSIPKQGIRLDIYAAERKEATI